MGMGKAIDPAGLSESGEQCVRIINRLRLLDLQTDQLISSILPPVESHVDRMLAGLIELSKVANYPLVREMLNRLEKDLFENWDGKMEWLAKGFSVKVRGETEYQMLKHVIESRNAIIHGNGTLTERQRGNFNQLVTLKRNLTKHLLIELHGIRMEFSPASRARVFEIVIVFIDAFDSAILSSFPEAKRL
ncbi:hypothetical protein IU501_09020 [Nocardia otitidiscaviarum]|uniref:hypothetical protein n=1 Tax=Nocardia otitidiscaviarum TaxID=1823 RepID=UPI0011DE07A7|nr:hypothetical protein [Nocardia otitidiscaviarum]MBF6133140.1 hypothetical protein [Nocardia otitidiscaviarum]MBF6486536.1 hypothetical protein [Nocardia otitidiscaviarum]